MVPDSLIQNHNLVPNFHRNTVWRPKYISRIIGLGILAEVTNDSITWVVAFPSAVFFADGIIQYIKTLFLGNARASDFSEHPIAPDVRVRGYSYFFLKLGGGGCCTGFQKYG